MLTFLCERLFAKLNIDCYRPVIAQALIDTESGEFLLSRSFAWVASSAGRAADF
jgi:hypothetical protein